MIKDTSLTKLDCLKGNFDPNEIKFKVGICFKAEIKTLDLIIEAHFQDLFFLQLKPEVKFLLKPKRANECVLQLIDTYNWKVTYT